MFNLEEFEQDQVIYPLVEKLDKLLDKNKTEKIGKIINQLEELLGEQKYAILISYILSILAEYDFTLIPESILNDLEDLLTTDDPKLKINTLIVIGFAMLSKQKYLNKYLPKFILQLSDVNRDVRDNIFYFLQEIGKKNPKFLCEYKKEFITALFSENINENLISLISFLEKCSEFDFENLYNLREALISLINQHFTSESSKIYSKILNLAKILFPSLKGLDIEQFGLNKLTSAIQDIFLMKKHNFTEISERTGVELKDFVKSMSKKNLDDRQICFYVNQKELKIVYFYELEKAKLLNLFGKEEKLQKKMILKIFSPVIQTEPELRLFIDTLIKLGQIKGYYSKLGYYYSYNYIKSELLNDLQNNGILNLKNFDYFPPEYVNSIISDISSLSKQVFLTGINGDTYYSLKNIQSEINTEAAKNTTIDLNFYREHLTDKDFIKLIKNLPKGYLTYFRAGTQLLTNVGMLKVKKEIENSKLIGFYSIPMLSEKLNVKREVLVQIFESFIDSRSGVFDKNKEIFYYSKFLNQKIEEIYSIKDQDERAKKINLMAKNLNIDRSHILTKLDENLKLIGEEIKEKDMIQIDDYREKTGMSYNLFIEFINNLDLNYFKKGKFLIFNENKIEESKNDIKSMLIEKSKSENKIQLGDIDVTSSIVENLLRELQSDEKIKGIFYINEGDLIFYTEKGIETMMLENSFMFSFHDFFYGMELEDKEIEILRSIFENLLKKKKLNGTFDEETLTFVSSDVVFAQDYNAVLFEFEKTVKSYSATFNSEFDKIKKILTKRNETIFPQEVRMIQERIDMINEKYIHWRNELESFVRKANTSLLKKQGYTMKKYRTMELTTRKKEDLKVFEEDLEVIDLLSNFNSWVKLFNEIELKYGNIIFYQKRLINDTENVENQKNLDRLLKKLKLV